MNSGFWKILQSMPGFCISSRTIRLFFRVWPKQSILLQTLTFLLSWEFVLDAMIASGAGPDWGCLDACFILKAGTIAHSSYPVRCSAEHPGGLADVHWIVLNWRQEVRVLENTEKYLEKHLFYFLHNFTAWKLFTKLNKKKLQARYLPIISISSVFVALQ